ncbi:MAG: hypothetical protein RJB66_2535 [Pseudomonadota bacterium]|jgi:hypothetical protein
MAFNLQSFNSWNETQSRCRYLLGIGDESIRCFPYQGVGHALIDILYGLKELWPTRKSIALSAYGSAVLKESVQGLVLSGVPQVVLESPQQENIDEWLNGLPKDLFAAVFVRDHSLTGEILTNDEELLKLNEKRIPHVEIQNGWAWSRAKNPQPFGIQIRVIDASKAVAVLGSRIRLNNHSANLMNWSDFEWEKPILESTVHHREAKDAIISFEQNIRNLHSGVRVYPFDARPRLFDRSLLVLDGVNGDFYLHELLKNLEAPPLRTSGFEFRCETTNLSRWNGPYSWPWWGKNVLSENEQRSLIVLSNSFIKQHLSSEKVNKVYLECLSRVQKKWEISPK